MLKNLTFTLVRLAEILDERLSFLPFFISDNTYSLPTSYLGKFNVEDINRFAKFASVKDLFGKIDQVFFQNILLIVSPLKVIKQKALLINSKNLTLSMIPFKKAEAELFVSTGQSKR